MAAVVFTCDVNIRFVINNNVRFVSNNFDVNVRIINRDFCVRFVSRGFNLIIHFVNRGLFRTRVQILLISL